VLLTADGLAAIQDQAPYHPGLVRLRAGADRAAFTARLADLELNSTAAPSEVGNLAQLRRLPTVLAALLAAVAVVSLANALTVAVRRRRDLAVLRALGFTRRQAGATVGWMATVTAAIGLLAGLPLGIAAGSVVWRLVAGGLHVADDARVPALVAAVVAATTVLLANLVAAVPAWRAARVRPALALRAE
jgi:ABC-type lipoprotein release transport system permease subunit